MGGACCECRRKQTVMVVFGEKRRKNNNNLCKVMFEVSKMFPAKRQTMLLLFSPH